MSDFRSVDLRDGVRAGGLPSMRGSGADGSAPGAADAMLPEGYRYAYYPFLIASGFMQQVLPIDEDRVGLILSCSSATDCFFVFDQGALAPVVITNDFQIRSLQIARAFPMDFFLAPTNAITVLGVLGATGGMIISASRVK